MPWRGELWKTRSKSLYSRVKIFVDALGFAVYDRFRKWRERGYMVGKRNYPRLYSLHEVRRVGRKVSYIRVSDAGMPVQQARRYWQNSLLSYFMGGKVEYSLRPVKASQP